MKRGGARRWLKRLGLWIAALVASLLVLVAALLAYLSTPVGGAHARDLGLKVINQALAGRLEVQRLQYVGRRFHLWGVTLHDPEGNEVARVEEVEARLSLPALISRELLFDDVRLVSPRLSLVANDTGLNLARAVAPREVGPGANPEGGSSLRVRVAALWVTDGEVRFTQEGGDEDRHARIASVEINGSGAYRAKEQWVEAHLRLAGAVAEPGAGPLSLTLEGQGQLPDLLGSVVLDLAGLHLAAKGGFEKECLRGEISDFTLAPELARVLMPSYPLKVPLRVSAKGSKEGSSVQVQLRAHAGSAKLEGHAAGDVSRYTIQELALSLRDADLAELMRHMPRTHLGFELSGHSRGKSLETLDAELDFRMPTSRIRDEDIGPINAKLRSKNGTVSVAGLQMTLPGLTVTANATGHLKQLRATATLHASDLSRFARTFSKLGGLPEIPLGGTGTLTLAVLGSLRHPAIQANGSFAAIAYGGQQLKNLTLALDLPDLRQPLLGKAQVAIGAVVLGARRLERVRLFLEREGRKVRAGLSSHGGVEAALTLAGDLDQDADGLTLSALTLSYPHPETTWSLAQPAHVKPLGEKLEVGPLKLVSAAQSIELTAHKQGNQLEAKLSLGDFLLEGLPSWLVPPEKGLAGRVDTDIRVHGALPRPDMEAKLRLNGGRFEQLTDISATLDARSQQDRVQGTVAMGMRGPRLQANFDVPIEGLLRRHHRKLSITAEFPDQLIGEFSCARSLARAERVHRLCLLEPPAPIQGHVSGKVTVSGYADALSVRVDVKGNDFAVGQTSGASFQLQAGSLGNEGAIEATLNAQMLQGKTHLHLSLPRTVSSLIAQPPRAEQLWGQPLKLEASGDGLQLAQLEAAGVVASIKGQLGFKVQLEGALGTPRGTIEVGVAQLEAADLPTRLDGQAVVNVSRDALDLHVTATQKGHPVVDVTGRLASGPDGLRALPRLRRAPLQLAGTLGPFALEELRAATALPGETITVRGQARAGFRIGGNLDAPSAVIDLDLNQLGMRDGTALGEIHAHYAYRDAENQLEARLLSGDGGELLIRAHSRFELGVSALEKSLSIAHAPLDAQVTSQRFDLAFLSGLIPGVRRIGGRLQIAAHLGGTLGAPTGLGSLEWQKGALALEGFGIYTDAHLMVNATEQRLSLSDLHAKSSAGSVQAKAEAHRAQGKFQLQGDITLDHFPIVSNDQLLATVTLKSGFEGDLSPSLVNVRRLNVPNATVELPDNKRKDLQPLERPPDIVLFRNGVRVRDRAAPQPKAEGEKSAGTSHAATQRQFVVVLEAPRNIWVKGSDINTEVGFSPGFRYEAAPDPALFGEIHVVRGRFDLLGRRFDVHRDSNAHFSGPLDKPTLNVTAEHFNERENVRVFITIRGRDKLSVKTTSEPPLAESEIYTLLATGRRTLQQGTQAAVSGADQAVSIIGSLAAGQLKQALRNKLPLDVISIEAGNSGYGLNGAKLEAGTYVLDRLYLGYTGQIGADRSRGQNANAARIEYQISPRWSFQAEYGDANVGGADIIWRKDF